MINDSQLQKYFTNDLGLLYKIHTHRSYVYLLADDEVVKTICSLKRGDRFKNLDLKGLVLELTLTMGSVTKK